MSGLQNYIKHFEGLWLVKDQNELHFDSSKSRCVLTGKDHNSNAIKLPLSDNLLSTHVLFLGNIGTGKTNAISQIISQIKGSLTSDDLMIIFDTKGDYYNEFYKAGDIIISNDTSKFNGVNDYWNIFPEVMIDNTPQSITENALEIASILFNEKIIKSNNPFFPQAARDVLSIFLDLSANNNKEDLLNNKVLIETLEGFSKKDLQNFFTGSNRVSSYISDSSGGQADGVISEFYQLLGEIFVGDFRRKGNLSMRELVRKKGGKTIFLEYDISVGNVITPIYRLLFDLAIKEALSSIKREKPKGNVWFFIDEFSLLPNLKYIDNGINFGRSQGAKFIIGVQNIPQVYQIYGENLGQSFLSGLRTVFSFHIDDFKSRELIQGRYGFAQKQLSFSDPFGKSVVNISPMKVIEDWDISNLKMGTTIVGLPDGNPFIFQFEKFQK